VKRREFITLLGGAAAAWPLAARAQRPVRIAKIGHIDHSQPTTATFSFNTGDTTFKSINWGRADEQLSSGSDYRKDDIIRVAQQLLSKLPR
jgi:hypothetical protein